MSKLITGALSIIIIIIIITRAKGQNDAQMTHLASDWV